MPKSKKPSSQPPSPPTSLPPSLRAEPDLQLDQKQLAGVLAALDRCEARLRSRYFDSWLKALNDPEGTRIRAALLNETFLEIRGDLTSGN